MVKKKTNYHPGLIGVFYLFTRWRLSRILIYSVFQRTCLKESVTVLSICIHRHQSKFIGGAPPKKGKKLKVAIIRGRRVELCSYLLEGGSFVFCYSFENKSAGCRSVGPSHRWCSCPLELSLLVVIELDHIDVRQNNCLYVLK